jgi:hypothetical protein
MSIAVAHPENPAKPSVGLPGRRYDHLFFPAMALLMLATVFAGFARTYYLAGVFHAPLPSRIIHVHGAVFTCWILLLVTQVSLVSAGRVDIHRRLGIAGMLLACVMVIVGVLAANDLLMRGGRAGLDAQAFYIVPLTDMLIFGTLIFFAFRARSNPPVHKRLIFVGTTAVLIAAVGRLPFVVVHKIPNGAALFSYVFLLCLVAYDLWSTRKVYRVTLWAAAYLIFVQQVRIPIGKTAAWHAFATWVQSIAR